MPKGLKTLVAMCVCVLATSSSQLNGATTVHASALCTGYPNCLQYFRGQVETTTTVHLIFWFPSSGLLQDGKTTFHGNNDPAKDLPDDYANTIIQFFNDIRGSGFFGIATQYYEDVNGPRHPIHNNVAYGGSLLYGVDYPSNDCVLQIPLLSNCIKPQTAENRIAAAMTTDSTWAPGLHDVYLLFTAPGEQVCGLLGCFAGSAGCAFHNHFSNNGDVIYGVVPYDDHCGFAFPGQFPLVHDAGTDVGVNNAAHELLEAVTDPDQSPFTPGTGWAGAGFTANVQGEIGDLCVGGSDIWGNNASFTLPFDKGIANQLINGHYYIIQPMWSNVQQGCVRTDGAHPQIDVQPNAVNVGDTIYVGVDDGVFQAGDHITVTYTANTIQGASTGIASQVCTGSAYNDVEEGGTILAAGGGNTAAFACAGPIPKGVKAGPPGVHAIVATDDTNGANISGTVTLNGQVVPNGASVYLSSADFGRFAIGQTAGPLTLTLVNWGRVKLTVTGVVLSTSAAQTFSIANDGCTGATVFLANSCAVGVTFAPRSVGQFSASISFSDNAPGAPQTVTLTGIGFAPTGLVTQFAVPNSLGVPFSITAGPDGALWFAASGGIGRVTTQGAVTTVLPAVLASGGSIISRQVGSITTGPDGALWFTETYNRPSATEAIGRLTTDGSVTDYPVHILSGAGQLPVVGGIASGPDGALWFTEQETSCNCTSLIGRITTSGSISEFPLPNQDSWPLSITAGSDGALWFTEMRVVSNTAVIGRITTTGSITEFSLPTFSGVPAGFGTPGYHAIVSGPDGALWFTLVLNNAIGRMTTSGSFSEFSAPGLFFPAAGYADGIASGSDGNLWFTVSGYCSGTSLVNAQVGRTTPSGAITLFPISGDPYGIASGSDGELWLAEYVNPCNGSFTGAIGQVAAG